MNDTNLSLLAMGARPKEIKPLPTLRSRNYLHQYQRSAGVVSSSHPIRYSTIILMLLLHPPNPAPAQTSIIAIRTPAYISVGADSRRTTTHITIDGQERQSVSKSIESICKIGHVGNVFFAIAGFRDADGHALAISSIRMAKTINEIASIFVEKVIPPLTEELEKVRRGVPDYYRQRFVDAEAVQMIFFGFENKIATLTYVVRVPDHCDHRIRRKVITESDGW